MSRRKRRRARFKGPIYGVRTPEKKTDRAPAPEVTEHEKFRRSLLDLVGEMREQASGATMGASLLHQQDAHPEAARFLMGMAIGISRVTDRLKGELDEDEIPF